MMEKHRTYLGVVLALLWMPAVPSAQAPMTNQDVVAMVEAGLSPRLIVSTIASAGPLIAFDVSREGLIALKSAGVADPVVEAMVRAAGRRRAAEASLAVRRSVAAGGPPVGAPDRSDRLSAARPPEEALQGFRTMAVNSSRAKFFGTDEMKAALAATDGFDDLGITIVDHLALADVVLEVGYTFAWDYPFSLRHQNTSVVLLSGKGVGPLSGPLGAADVARELVRALAPFRERPE